MLAGFVDAVGFVSLGGFFVSFMSGNTTRMAVGLAGDLAHAAEAATLIGAFVAGVVLGSLCGHVGGKRRIPVVLALVAMLLAVAAAIDGSGEPILALGVAAAGMGAVNAVFESNDDVRFGVTYMTGALVKIGQRLALALRGGPRFGWAPYLIQWSALAFGAFAGAMLYPRIGLSALWLASAASASFALISARLAPHAG